MSHKLALLAGLSSLAIAHPAFAQEVAAAPNAGAGSSGVEEIVVTAQKRSESAQSVPVAVSVVTAAALQASGGTQFTDLSKVAPGLTMTQGDQPGNNQIYLRGVGTFAFSIGVEPSVLTVIDDVAVGLQAQSFGDLSDLQRIEVLRGPQSTLFGKAASAGVINVTTQAPSKNFTGKAEVMVTDDNEQRYVAGVSGPLSDQVGFRVTGTLGRYKGNVTNLTTGNKLNGRNYENVRAKLRFEPASGFDATLSGYYTSARQNCCAQPVVYLAAPTNVLGQAALPSSAALAGITVGPDNNKVRQDVEPQANVEDYGGSLKMNLQLGEHTLTSITAATHYNLKDTTDFDNTDLAVNAAFGGAATGGFTQGGSFDAKTFSQELRLTSPSGNAFEYLVGAYYANNRFTRRFRRDAAPVQVRNWQGNTSSKSEALFVQGSLKLAEGFKLLAGARLNHETIAYTYTNNISGLVLPTAANLPGSASDTAVTGKAGLQYEPNSDLNFFATYSRGYKGQAYDLTSSFSAAVAASQPIKPETVNAFEVGLKSRLWDRKLQFNLTLFLEDFNNYQQQSLDPVLPATFVLTNVGSVRTKGVEADFVLRPVDGFKLSGSLAYTDAKVRSFPIGQCYPGQTAAQGCIAATATVPAHQDLAGMRLNNAPEWKGNITADYTTPISNGIELGANLSYSFQSKINYSITQDPVTAQGAYGILNAALSVGSRQSDQWKLTAFVRNLANKHYLAGMTNNRQLWGVNQVSGVLPRDFERTWGLRAAYNF